MYFVEVIVADTAYHKNEPLTYSCSIEPVIGTIVVVPLKRKQVLAIVTGTVARPKFPTKEIILIPDLPPLPRPLCALLDWMRGYYPAPLGITAQLFLPSSLPKKQIAQTLIEPMPALELPNLTEDQQVALQSIHSPGLHVLHGDTGTGKTRVYIELIQRALSEKKSTLILTPEIGLTSQLTKNLQSVFGNKVVVVHSGLTDATRRQTWQKLLLQAEPTIVVGARSALFAPLKQVGLIVVDEAHEPAYKQDQAPYYHTTSVAAKLASLHNATVVLGSATPLVADYYVAESKHRPIVRMTKVAANDTEQVTTTKVIDLKNRTLFTKSQYLSNDLLEALQDRLQRGEQSLLFLNRRGTARIVFCEKCGWQAACPHCDLALVYHGDLHRVRCHSCSYQTASPTSCPSCKSASVVFKSIGTKAIVSEVERLFPEARTMRFDTDNKKDQRLDAHFNSIHAGDVDILVGTQTLAKGLDLPKLSLVGVLVADTSLYFPDFSAQERTFQLLAQVIGRIGRGHRAGMAIIQTYDPKSVLLTSVLAKDWISFYNNELAEREQFLFPPFCYLLQLTCKRASSQSAQKAAEEFAQKLHSLNYNIRIEGPSPSFHEKIQNKFAWQLIVKSKRRDHLTAIVNNLPSGWTHNIDPINLL
jgi:primosomal protein N' (replication factor Y)